LLIEVTDRDTIFNPGFCYELGEIVGRVKAKNEDLGKVFKLNKAVTEFKFVGGHLTQLLNMVFNKWLASNWKQWL
jgi:hypothetical protein